MKGEIVMSSFECPTCKSVFTVARAEKAPFRPFCSQRCKLVDLGRWLDGTYSVVEPMPGTDETTRGTEEGPAG